MIDERVGAAELDRLAETLAPPHRLGDYMLRGLIRKTSTSLIFIACGGVFGVDEGVMKLTGHEYAPLLERELNLLHCCQQAEVAGMVRPVQAALEWLDVDASADASVAAILMPFLSGGDLVQWIGAHATPDGELGPDLALTVGVHVAGVLRDLLRLPKPLVHRDVKPQNLLLPYPEAPLATLTLIDLDAAEELNIPLSELASAPREIAQKLVEDVHGFGALLFNLATGCEPPPDGSHNPRTGHAAFDSVVVTCLASEVDGPGYTCLADTRLWHDLDSAVATHQPSVQPRPRRMSLTRYLLDRRALACVGVLLFIGLVVAVASKVLVG